MQIDLKRHPYTVYEEDVPVAHFSNPKLAYETAFLRWRWNTHVAGDGALLMRADPMPHSVHLPDGRYVHARDIAMSGWEFDRVLKFSSTPWKRIAPEQMQHWAVMV